MGVMDSTFYGKKSKLYLSIILLVFAVTVIIFCRFDASRQNANEYMDKPFKHMIAYDASKEINQKTRKPTVSQGINLAKRKPLRKSKDILKVKMVPGLMELINPPNPKFAVTVNESFLLEHKDHCSSVSNLTILVMVLSTPDNFERRIAIRETWGNESFYSDYGTIKVIFLLGIINDFKDQGAIERESKFYGDIVQGSFIDCYHNLSHKSVMGYKWATERCRNAKYVLKTDDDIVINLFRVFKSDIHVLSVKQNHVHCVRKMQDFVIRSKEIKWYVEPNQFKGRTFYPPYCVGQYLLMLNIIVPYIYKAASQTPLFWIDDVFMYGIVMGNLPELKFRQITIDEIGTNGGWKEEGPHCNYIFQVTESVTEMKRIWAAIMDQCSQTTVIVSSQH